MYLTSPGGGRSFFFIEYQPRGFGASKVAVLITDEHLQLVAEGPVPRLFPYGRGWEKSTQ